MMITVKFVNKGSPQPIKESLLRQIPGTDGVWDHCHFITDANATQYDWLVVYDDLPNVTDERYSTRIENLQCPRENTIFIMAEPHSIKTYGYDFLNQFGTIISCHPSYTSSQHKTRQTIPGLVWFHGNITRTTYDEMTTHPPVNKTGVLSMVYSAKAMNHTLHSTRQTFMKQLVDLMPELDMFGKNYIPLPDKKDSLDPYKYHIAMENTIYPNYISEKITDPFLGLCLPFYVGAPNVEDYFPAESFIRLDPNKPEEAVAIIRNAIANNEYEKRLPAIMEARRLVMEEYNMFAIAKNIIAKREAERSSSAISYKPSQIYSRRAILKKNPWIALRFILEKTFTRVMNRIKM
jgi:hypothetical protein